jgi:hypothetical protein
MYIVGPMIYISPAFMTVCIFPGFDTSVSAGPLGVVIDMW